MNRELKEELKRIYAAPEPQQKQAFLRRLDRVEISLADFLRIQVGYIRVWSYILSGVFFCLVILSLRYWDKEVVWIVASLTPFLALITVTESSRSAKYGMEELEMSARFTLKAIVMARLGIMGTCNLLALGILLPIVKAWNAGSMLDTGLYIFLPYLLTAYLDLIAVRKIHGKESMAVCMGVTVLVSGFSMIATSLQLVPYELMDIGGWLAVTLLLGLLVGRECMKLNRQTEEYVWN